MTFGIDTSTHQAGLSIAAARVAGARFNIVKAVASYLPNLTVAADYHLIIDRTIAAGLGNAKGHYAVPNSRNSPVATARFQWKIRYRAADTDVYMLDNEPLDDYPVFWRDASAAAYFEELHRLGARYSQMWLYCPADLTRRSGPWPRINALRKLGLKIVWVSYGPNYPGPTGMVPDHDVSLGTAPGRIDGWDVRQFTSNFRVPGYPRGIDGNYSPHSISTLFGGKASMGLKDYVLNGPSVVILDDDRDPYVSWQHHLDRTAGQRGGVDLVAKIGTPVLAPTDGWVRRRPNNGSAGNSMWFEHKLNKGWGDVFSHLSRYVGADDQYFEQDAIIAYSGDTGGVVQHLHRHLEKGGVRFNPWDYFTGSTPADNGDVIIIDQSEEDEMEPFIITESAAAVKYLYKPSNKTKRSIGKEEWSIMRKGEAAGVPLRIAIVTRAELNAIPGK